jgi:hypothetical protein
VAEEAGDANLCQCKHSSNLPFCDGSRKQFDENLIGKEGPGMDVQASKTPLVVATIFVEEVLKNKIIKCGKKHKK